MNESISDCHSFKFIKNLTPLERQHFLDSFDIVLCDCDGVIWRALGEGIPGAATAIDYLQKQGKQVAFVTNNSIIPIEEQLKKFHLYNFKIQKQDVIHPAQTISDHLKAQNFEGLIFCMASPSFKSLLTQAGFQLAEMNEGIVLESAQELRAAIYKTEPIKAVIIDVDFNLTALKLMRAHLYLRNPECIFICGAADELIPFGGGDIIGSGPFINVVEKAAKRKAIILGKPGRDLCEVLKSRFNLHDKTQRALFVGDSLTSDVRFAKMCGFQTMVVLTGGTTIEDLNTTLPADETPDYVAESLGELDGLV